MPPSNIVWHLERLQLGWRAGDREFRTRAPVLFEAELSGSARKDRVRIDGMKAAVFKAVLHFIYTDDLPAMDDLLVAVPVAGDGPTMIAGDMLAAARPGEDGGDVREHHVTPEDAAATLKLADRHH